jgi:hypothetical protein
VRVIVHEHHTIALGLVAQAAGLGNLITLDEQGREVSVG